MARKFNLALSLGIAGGLCLAALAGCGSDDDEDTPVGGAGAAGTGGGTAGTGGGTAGSGGGTAGTGGGTVDNDNDCASATDISTTGTGAGVIDPANDADFYKISLPAGEFVILRANAVLPADVSSPDDLAYETVLDATITVYDESGTTQIAAMDDAFPRFNMDSELIWRVPAAATYCIKIADWATWAAADRPDPITGENFEYEFGVYSPNAGVDGTNMDTEENNTVATAQVQTLAGIEDPPLNYVAWTYGMLDAGTDVDVYSITTPAGVVNLSIDDLSTPTGPGAAGQSGNGSTLQLGVVNLSNASGDNIIAQLDATKGSSGLSVPVEPETPYLLWVNRDGATTGANDFYNLVQFAYNQDNQKETETDTGENDTPATAEEPTSSAVDTSVSGYFILGNIGVGDVDFWSFPAAAGDEISLACGAARSGSGLQGATFEIDKLDGANATLVQKETETETADIYWSNNPNAGGSQQGISVAAAGTYYLKVSTTGQKADVSSNFYRCGIYIATP